jgi:hypothetical protein
MGGAPQSYKVLTSQNIVDGAHKGSNPVATLEVDDVINIDLDDMHQAGTRMWVKVKVEGHSDDGFVVFSERKNMFETSDESPSHLIHHAHLPHTASPADGLEEALTGQQNMGVLVRAVARHGSALGLPLILGAWTRAEGSDLAALHQEIIKAVDSYWKTSGQPFSEKAKQVRDFIGALKTQKK